MLIEIIITSTLFFVKPASPVPETQLHFLAESPRISRGGRFRRPHSAHEAAQPSAVQRRTVGQGPTEGGKCLKSRFQRAALRCPRDTHRHCDKKAFCRNVEIKIETQQSAPYVRTALRCSAALRPQRGQPRRASRGGRPAKHELDSQTVRFSRRGHYARTRPTCQKNCWRVKLKSEDIFSSSS